MPSHDLKIDHKSMPLTSITNNHQHHHHHHHHHHLGQPYYHSNEYKVAKPKLSEKRQSYKYGQYPHRKRVNEQTSPTPMRSVSDLGNREEERSTNGTSLSYKSMSTTTPSSKRVAHKPSATPMSSSSKGGTEASAATTTHHSTSSYSYSSSSPFIESPAEDNYKSNTSNYNKSPSLSTHYPPNNNTDAPPPSAPNYKFDDFEIGRVLGKGKLGKVYCAKHKPSGYLVALKVMSKKELSSMKLERNFRREIEIQSSLYHVNITHLHTWFHDDTNVYLVLEFSLYGELYQELRKLKRFDNVKASHYIYQVTLALRYLHEKKVVHRDIKPENIMLSLDNVVKLSDFGWSVYMKNQDEEGKQDLPNNVHDDDEEEEEEVVDNKHRSHISHMQNPSGAHPPLQQSNRRNTICGTMDYLPPEMIESKPHDKAVDIWALGVLIYELLVGKPPFEEVDKNATYKRIAKVDLRFPKYLPPSGPSGPNGANDRTGGEGDGGGGVGANIKESIKRKSVANDGASAMMTTTAMDLDAIDLIRRLLRYEPSERLSLDGVLRHPWITKHKPYWPTRSKSR
ncbi:IPL1 [Candida theae]|uniref:Aurora kinase n=1 Tax=Candida theae TaxID=1198502 RepID=A0AAD5BGD6_9ASCO|nr:IPL1 [Candida theae]KAI5959246.1 IPL1 [Candida theae]